MSLPVLLAFFSHPLFLAFAIGLALLLLGLGIRAYLRPGVGVQVVGQRPLWLGLGMGLLLFGVGVGLAEPRYGAPEVPRLTVHVVLDASKSMRVKDLGGVSRWDGALRVLDNLWDEAPPHIRYSLSLLTGDLIPLMPPGEDRALLRDVLKAVVPGDLGSPGTSMGRGIPQLMGQLTPKVPEVVLLVGDGEESWESETDAHQRALAFLKAQRLPLYAVCIGKSQASEVPPIPGEAKETHLSGAKPDFLRQLTEASGGKLLAPEDDLAHLFQSLASGAEPLPIARSLSPRHPEWGAWLAMIGLLLWLFAAGKPMRFWRPVLLLLLCWMGPAPARAIPLPESVKAWLAQSAMDRGDLEAAKRYAFAGKLPTHRLLAAHIALKSREPQKALEALAPLTGQGAPRPLPEWRPSALLLAARAHLALDQRQEAKDLLERLLREEPGRKEAVHNLQALTKDQSPPPPSPKKPPPPPPPRPSQGARQDEMEGIQQRLPQKETPQGGVKDI